MDALYYPFHLCHDRTLKRLLADYQTVHFRDFMALQLTPFVGTTAFPDRMGDYHHELLLAGRIVQGDDVSGAMKSETVSAVNRDLGDAHWRRLFQDSLLNDHRFQWGLFADPKAASAGPAEDHTDSDWLSFRGGEWVDTPFQVEAIQALSRQQLHGEKSARFEYGWSLIKTAASLIYTIQLCHQRNLLAMTDSVSHYHLLQRTCERDQITLEHSCVRREGY